jgi:hypothetical protein
MNDMAYCIHHLLLFFSKDFLIRDEKLHALFPFLNTDELVYISVLHFFSLLLLSRIEIATTTTVKAVEEKNESGKLNLSGVSRTNFTPYKSSSFL